MIKATAPAGRAPLTSGHDGLRTLELLDADRYIYVPPEVTEEEEAAEAGHK